MLKSLGKVPLLLRFGRSACICLRSRDMDNTFRARVRPFVIGWYSCWCDRSAAPTTGGA